ncbi:MAG: radical SAM protein [Eubacteriaceae bacterium]|nr:radical SAM protein [Eubacteriaceae bacterium]
MKNKAFHIGPIRPPSEAQSLLLQVTNGCTWNRCKFCRLYRHTKFKAYTVDDVKRDIDKIAALAERAMKFKKDPGVAGIGNEIGWDVDGLNRELSAMEGDEQQCYYMVINWLMTGGENVFLQDGNTVVLSGGKLTEVLRYLKTTFPSIKRITSYGRAENLSKVSAEEFAELKEAGLDRIHSGFESGSDAVLEMVNKGVTAEQQIRAGKNIKAGGIQLSVYFMPGLGGKELSRENALGMAHVVSSCDPDFVRIRTAAVKPGTELYDDLEAGKFTLCSEDDKVREIRTLVEKADFSGSIVSDHIVNLLQDVEGSCRKDRSRMLKVIDDYLGMPENARRIYQMARRLGRVSRPSQIDLIPESEISRLDSIARGVPDAEWDVKMNEMIGEYI